MPELVLPTTTVRESFLEAMDEFVAEGVELSQTAAWIEHNAPGWKHPDAFAVFVEKVRADALAETPRPEWHVPCTTLWWVDGEDYLGRIAIARPVHRVLLGAQQVQHGFADHGIVFNKQEAHGKGAERSAGDR